MYYPTSNEKKWNIFYCKIIIILDSPDQEKGAFFFFFKSRPTFEELTQLCKLIPCREKLLVAPVIS